MAGETCNQINIPTVDNTVPDCLDIVKEQCINMTTVRTSPIDIAINEDFTTVFNRLLQHIITLEARIIVLENYNITNP